MEEKLIKWLDESIKDLEEWIELIGNASEPLFYSGQRDAFHQVKHYLEYPTVEDCHAAGCDLGVGDCSKCAGPRHLTTHEADAAPVAPQTIEGA